MFYRVFPQPPEQTIIVMQSIGEELKEFVIEVCFKLAADNFFLAASNA
jgi:hypothetical protein